jgi:Retinal pigment epithelial membrane protein
VPRQFRIQPSSNKATAPEADGYIISIANKKDKMLTDIVILDTAKLTEGPVAIIELPFRLRNGIHGSWVHANDLLPKKDLCDMHNISTEVRTEFSAHGDKI